MNEATAPRQQIVLEVPIPALFKLFETDKVSTGDTHEAPGGATLKSVPSGRIERKSIEHRELLEAVLVTFGSGVAINLFSSWLYEKLKAISEPRMRKIKINRSEVEITPDGIARAIKESIEIEEK